MMSTVSTVSTMSTRVSRHCYQASTNQLLNHYDVYNIYSLYSLYKGFQGLLMFVPYAIEERGERNVPLIYLKEARWRTVRGSTGYFVNIPTRPSQYYPVEFNHIYLCWCEIT